MEKKVIGFMVCGPNEASRYLEGSLKEFKRLCDDALIVCNNTDKATEEMITAYGYRFYRDDREWGKFQPMIKTDLLERIGKEFNPDWILPIDADERYASDFTRDSLENLMSTQAVAYYFYIVNLWNDEKHYKKAISFWNIRAFKYDKNQTRFLSRNVHCGLAPPYAYQFGRYAPFILKHYGLMQASDRMKKVDRYKKYDPKASKVGIGGWYEALADTGTGSEFDEQAVSMKVREEVVRMNQKDKLFSMQKIEREWVVLRNPKSGREFDVPKKMIDHYLKQGCIFLRAEVVPDVPSIAELPAVELPPLPVPPVPEEPKAEESKATLSCPTCSKSFKSDAWLQRHIVKVHAPNNT